MLKIFHKYMGKPIRTILTFLFLLSQVSPRRKMCIVSKENGLDMVKFAKAMDCNMFINKYIIVNELGIRDDDIEKAIGTDNKGRLNFSRKDAM